MSALLDFTSHVTVLPPGCWDKNNRIEPPKVMPAKVTEINISKLTLNTENKKTILKKYDENDTVLWSIYQISGI